MSKPENPPLFVDIRDHANDRPMLLSDVTLRDLFAAAALAGAAADPEVTDAEAAARWCYRLADAMLAAREESE